MFNKDNHNKIISADDVARGKRFGDIQWDSHSKTLASVSYTHLTLPTSDLV